MNILKVLSAGGVLALSVGAANAATYYATDVIASDPGFCDTTRDGGACSKPSRYNPNNAKGAPDGRFYSLGLTTYNDDGSVDDEGSITLGFGTTFPTQQDVGVWEVTYNISPTSRHREAVDVYAIMGGVETLLGRLTNLNGGGKVLAGMGFEYIKLVDATLNEFGRSGTTSFDGFDVDSVSVAPVPLPAAGLMLLAGLGGFGVMRRRQKKA